MAPEARPLSRSWSGSSMTQTSRPGTLAVGGVKVRPISRSFVVPGTPTEKHWLSLSNLDRVVNPTFSSVIFFYKNQATYKIQKFEDVTGSLKDSLARVLVEFYPMAGRLSLRGDGLVDLHCNDEGAVFIEASVEAELSALGGPQPMAALSGLQVARLGPGPTYIPDQLTSLPVLVIMVTKFKCGSVAVAANWHHTVADGSSGCHFIKSWAEMASRNDISLIPNHDRSLLKPRPRNHPDDCLVNGYSTRKIDEVLERVRDDAEWAKSYLPQEPAILGSFHISKGTIEGLKEDVSMHDEEGHQFTSVESICAYLWQQMTKARADKKEDIRPRYSQTQFFIFVDGRKRLNLPPGYFGNVVCSACAVSDEEDILKKPLAYAANLVRKAIRGASREHFRSLIDWVEIQGNVPSKSEHVNSLGHDVAATFWTSFPMYEMDFGWGKPELAARNSPARPLIDGIAMMPSAKGSGDMVALLNLHADRMDRLTRQASFKAVFS